MVFEYLSYHGRDGVGITNGHLVGITPRPQGLYLGFGLGQPLGIAAAQH